MSGFLSLFRKELRQLFQTPIPYVVVGIFWVATGYFFSFNVFLVRAAHMVTTFHNMSLLLMLVIPLVTMRVFAEEKRGGTLELLLTLPLGEVAIVGAKFAAVWLLLFFMLLGTAAAVVPLWIFATPDVGPILGGYIGVFSLGTAFVSLGVLISVLSENQVSAATGCWALLLALWFIDYAAGLPWGAGWVHSLQHLSFSAHSRDLVRGVLTAEALIYFASISILSLVWAVQILRFRRS